MPRNSSPRKRYEVSFVPNNDSVLLDEEKLSEKGITKIKDFPYGLGSYPEGYEINLDEMESNEMYVLHKGRNMNTGIVKEKDKLKIYKFFRDNTLDRKNSEMKISQDAVEKLKKLVKENKE